MLISERIYEYLEKRGITQSEFANKTGISQSNVFNEPCLIPCS